MGTASTKVVILNELGLHARPATLFSETAARHAADVTVWRTDTGERANGKKAMSLLQLILLCGTEIRIEATGDDAQETVDELVGLVEARFGLE